MYEISYSPESKTLIAVGLEQEHAEHLTRILDFLRNHYQNKKDKQEESENQMMRRRRGPKVTPADIAAKYEEKMRRINGYYKANEAAMKTDSGKPTAIKPAE